MISIHKRNDMKYKHLLLTSALVPSILSAIEIKRSFSITKKTLTEWVYREKTTITFPGQLNYNNNDNDDSAKTADEKISLDTHNGTEETDKYSSRKHSLEKQPSFERH